MSERVQIEGPASGKRLFWTKKVGAHVKEGEMVASYEEAKRTQGIPSPATGTLTEIAIDNGALTQGGKPIGFITVD